MLSQKIQDDLMSAYQKVYESKRGHAAGDSDVEKQASQLASDVKYKAKGKVKPGASEEEKKKIYMQILSASPAPNAVKAMAKSKILGEEVVLEDKKMSKQSDDDLAAAHKKFSGMDQSTPSNKFMLKRIEKEMKKRKSVKEGTSYGLYKGTGKASGAMKKFLDKKAEKLQKEYDSQSKEKKNNPAFQSNRLNPKPVYNSHEPQGEVVSEMGGMKVKQVVKPKKPMNPQNMALPKDAKSGVNYQAMSQSYEPVGNIFNEKKMDPVGQEDKDIDNDGDHDSTDKYLLKRRKAIGKAIAKKRGKVKEGFSAWRIDLDFNEQVKK